MERNELQFVLKRKARLQLQRLIADGNTPQNIVKRATIILMTADGHVVMAIMRKVGVSKTTIWRWQEFFAEAGVAGRSLQTARQETNQRSDQTQGRPEDRGRNARRLSPHRSGAGRHIRRRLSGEVLEGGNDWRALIEMTYCGVRHGPPGVIARLEKGEVVDAAEYYFRIAAGALRTAAAFGPP